MDTVKIWSLGLIMIVSIGYLGYVPSQSDFLPIIGAYSIAFLAYYVLLKSKLNLRQIIVLAILLRIILVPAFPNLSDDIYRFIWDGHLTIGGMNPYLYLPSQLMQDTPDWIPNAGQLFDELNSPKYYTIYPPVSQAVFAISVLAGGGKLIASTLIMKVILLGFELSLLAVLLALLKRCSMPIARLAIYALNPLVIVEIMGNMHFEGIMLFFLCLAWLAMLGKKFVGAAMAFSLSIAAKLLPLMLLPFLIVYYGWKRAILFFTYVGIGLLLLFVPVWTKLPFFLTSVDLYFQKFEFNASIYYLLRWVGFQIKGFNLIHILGPALAISTILIIARLCYAYSKAKLETLPEFWLLAFVSYLCLATTVHPWYLILPIGVCMFTRFRFPILWSFLILLSYVNYSYEPYYENLWFVSFEYMILIAAMAYELLTRQDEWSPMSNV